MRAVRFLVAAALVAACGNQVIQSEADGSVDASSDGGKEPLGTPIGTLVAACPTSRPESGMSCNAVSGVICEYGNDPNWACNEVFYCSPPESCMSEAACAQFAWMPYAVGPMKCPSPPLVVGPGCPASHAEAAKGGDCSKEADVCAYSEGICACAAGVWACAMPESGCPLLRPRIGSPCPNPNLTCNYGVCPGYPEDAVFVCNPPAVNEKVSALFWAPGCPSCEGTGGSGGG
jgi:hypothetical protein